MTPQEIQEREDAMMRAIEAPFINRVVKEKNRFIRDAAPAMASTGGVPDSIFFEHQSRMRDIFDRYYRATIETFTQELLQRESPKHFLIQMEKKEDLWDFFARQFFSEEAGSAASLTSSTTLQDLRNILLSTIESTESVSQQDLVRQLLQARGLSRFRAQTIARTETHNAATYASLQTVSTISAETGITKLKKWQPVQDDRTRREPRDEFNHLIMLNSPAIPLDAKFDVSGEAMERPGDTTASPGNFINCRCVLVYETILDF